MSKLVSLSAVARMMRDHYGIRVTPGRLRRILLENKKYRPPGIILKEAEFLVPQRRKCLCVSEEEVAKIVQFLLQ